MMLSRRDFLATSATAVASVAASAAPVKRPNLIFILADDLGYGDLGCYGQKRIQTPRLDTMAAEGMRFTQAYAGATVCAPSRCCLMTGKHTGHATVRGNKRPEVGLRPDEATVASVLKQAGYRTALFGKWGLGGPGAGSVPNRKGFDEFYGYLDQLHAHNSFPEHLWDNQHEVFLTENWFNGRKTFSNDVFTEKATGFLEKQTANDPFFLYLAYTIPHANNERGRIEANGMDVPDLGIYAKEPWSEAERSFAAAITRMDTQVGGILDLLRRRGLDRKTLVVFSSDNGPHKEGNRKPEFFNSSGPLRGIKRDLYEGGIRVPTMAWWPGRIKERSVSDQPWAFWDWMPTVAELAGTRAPAGGDGVSIVPLLDGGSVKRDHFYWEFHEGGFQQAVRQGNWKLVRQLPRMQMELYDLSTDVGETRDLATQKPDVVARLSRLFQTARVESAEFPAA